jgi:hypothetical protein
MARRPSDAQYSEQETAHRRDEVIRRMANTPPQPRVTTPVRRGKRKKAAAGHAAGKGRADRED